MKQKVSIENCGIEIGKVYGGRRVVSEIFYGTNQHLNEDLMVHYYYEGEDRSKNSPIRCSVQTFKRAVGI